MDDVAAKALAITGGTGNPELQVSEDGRTAAIDVAMPDVSRDRSTEIIGELREDSDPLVKKITESFIAYRDLVGGYMVYADNGQMNARAMVRGY